MKISIIVPVYNVEAYIEQCVHSVLCQSERNWELILVDDGSCDQSPSICDALAQKDSRIFVIHKPNGGLSDARNAGLQAATGEYVLFLDGDDFWATDAVLARLVERARATNADILCFSYAKFYEDERPLQPYFQGIEDMPLGLSHHAQLRFLEENGAYIASACNKMIRRNLLSPFEKGIFSEDIFWSAELLTQADSIDFIGDSLYCYRQRSSSIRHQIKDKNCTDLTEQILRCITLAEHAQGAEKSLLQAYSAFQFATFFAVQAQAEHPQKACIAKLRPYRRILRHHRNNKKVRLLHYACNLLGMCIVCKLLRGGQKLRK